MKTVSMELVERGWNWPVCKRGLRAFNRLRGKRRSLPVTRETLDRATDQELLDLGVVVPLAVLREAGHIDPVFAKDVEDEWLSLPSTEDEEAAKYLRRDVWPRILAHLEE